MTSSALAERPTERQQLRVGLQNVRLWVHRTDFAGLRCGGNGHGVVRLAHSHVSIVPPPQRVQTLIRRVR